MSAAKRSGNDGEAPGTAPPSDEQLAGMARMIEYVSLEARETGLYLTAHLLDLAAWSIQEVRDAPPRGKRREAHFPKTTPEIDTDKSH